MKRQVWRGEGGRWKCWGGRDVSPSLFIIHDVKRKERMLGGIVARVRRTRWRKEGWRIGSGSRKG